MNWGGPVSGLKGRLETAVLAMKPISHPFRYMAIQ